MEFLTKFHIDELGSLEGLICVYMIHILCSTVAMFRLSSSLGKHGKKSWIQIEVGTMGTYSCHKKGFGSLQIIFNWNTGDHTFTQYLTFYLADLLS